MLERFRSWLRPRETPEKREAWRSDDGRLNHHALYQEVRLIRESVQRRGEHESVADLLPRLERLRTDVTRERERLSIDRTNTLIAMPFMLDAPPDTLDQYDDKLASLDGALREIRSIDERLAERSKTNLMPKS